jgi:hypothetical protein
MGCDRSGQTVILVVGRPLALPWNFADDDLGACTRCDALVRYRARGRGAVLVCPACIGADPGDVWILPGAPPAARQAPPGAP